MAKDAIKATPTSFDTRYFPFSDSLRPLNMLIAPHESMLRRDSTGLQKSADCLTILLRNGESSNRQRGRYYLRHNDRNRGYPLRDLPPFITREIQN